MISSGTPINYSDEINGQAAETEEKRLSSAFAF